MSMEEKEILVAEGKCNTGKRWCKTEPQLKAARQAAEFGWIAGALDGWIAIAIPYLQQADNVTVARITYREASWIASLSHLGSLFGSIPGAYLYNRLGRRFLMLIMGVPIFLSWLMILYGYNSIELLYIARFILGFYRGVATVVYYLYSGEIAENCVRVAVGTYLDFKVTLGMLYLYFSGAILSYVHVIIVCTVGSVLYSVASCLEPESPMYLLTKDQTEEAEKSLRGLRGVDTGHSAEIEGELNEMKSFINRPTESTSVSAFLGRVFTTSKSAKDRKIVFGLMVFRQLCGINAILAYIVYVYQRDGSTSYPDLCIAIVGVAQVVSSFIPYLKVGHDIKMKLAPNSVAGLRVCLLAILFYSLLNQGKEIKYLELLPLIAVNLYIVSFSVGLGPVPWFKRSDRLSKKDRVWVISIGVSLNFGLAFFVTKFYPIMLKVFGPEATFSTVAVICLVGTVVINRWVVV